MCIRPLGCTVAGVYEQADQACDDDEKDDYNERGDLTSMLTKSAPFNGGRTARDIPISSHVKVGFQAVQKRCPRDCEY